MRLKPKDLQNLNPLVKSGIIYTQLEDYDKAIASFNEAVEQNPQDALAFVFRGLTYAIMGEQEAAYRDNACSDLQEAVRLDPRVRELSIVKKRRPQDENWSLRTQ